jgi:hypothetical protein
MIIVAVAVFLLGENLTKPYSRCELQYKYEFIYRHLTTARRESGRSFGLLNKKISLLENVVRSSAEEAELFITNACDLCNCLMK